MNAADEINTLHVFTQCATAQLHEGVLRQPLCRCLTWRFICHHASPPRIQSLLWNLGTWCAHFVTSWQRAKDVFWAWYGLHYKWLPGSPQWTVLWLSVPVTLEAKLLNIQIRTLTDHLLFWFPKKMQQLSAVITIKILVPRSDIRNLIKRSWNQVGWVDSVGWLWGKMGK